MARAAEPSGIFKASPTPGSTANVQNLGRRYFGGYAGYEITPLLKWANYAVLNLGDHSRFYSPELTLSLRENVDLRLGAQLFGGSAGSEYGRFEDLYYAELRWSF